MSNLYNGVIAYPGTTTVTPQIPTPENLPPRGGSSFKLSGNMWGAIAGAASGIMGLFGNKSNNDAIAAENEKNRQWQAEQATIAFNRQRQLTKEQNEWNSYKNQRKLMEQAGYNPNLMVSGTAGVAQSNSSTNAPQANTPVTGMPSSVMSPEVINTLASARLMESEAKKNDKESQLIGSQDAGQKAQNVITRFQADMKLKFGEKWERYGLTEKQANIFLLNQQGDLIGTQDDLARYDFTNMRPRQLQNVIADTLSKNTQSYLNEALAANTRQEILLNLGRYFMSVELNSAMIRDYIASSREHNANAAMNEVGGPLYDYWRSEADVKGFDAKEREAFYNNVFPITNEFDRAVAENNLYWQLKRLPKEDADFWDDIIRYGLNYKDGVEGLLHGSVGAGVYRNVGGASTPAPRNPVGFNSSSVKKPSLVKRVARKVVLKR